MSSMWKALMVLLVAASVVPAQQAFWDEFKPLRELFTGKEGHDESTEAKQQSLDLGSGEEAYPHQFPFMVGIVVHRQNQSDAFCGGSILSESVILTAAHCAAAGYEFVVIAGAHDVTVVEESQQLITTTWKKIHESYGGASVNDIALLFLPEELKIQEGIVEPIRLPSSERSNYWLKRTITSGWGWTFDGSGVSPVLRYVESRVVSNLYCKLRYFFTAVGGKNICVSGLRDKGTCHGDAGGPLFYLEEDGQPTLIGVTAFGITFGCEFTWPTVFTRVSSYLDWIELNMDDEE